MAKLLIEQVDPEEVKFVTEATESGAKHFYITGPFMRAEIVNGNRRKYPANVMESAVNKYVKELVEDKRAYGELQHPDSPKINLKEASHRIVSLTREGNDWIGKAIIMPTPNGDIAKAIMETGGKLGVSSRGLGTLREQDGVNVVQDDFQIATAADIVHDPSAQGAFVTGLMEEKEWIWESGVWREADLSKAKKNIKESSKAEMEATVLRNFKVLMSKMSK